MAPQGIVHKKTEENWTLEISNGVELPILSSDVVKFYQETITCGKELCSCWILKEGLVVEYQIIEQDGIQYANLI
jgi:hypothetical protein